MFFPFQKKHLKYFLSLKRFGTHYIRKIHMGGKMLIEVTISEASTQEMKSSGKE